MQQAEPVQARLGARVAERARAPRVVEPVVERRQSAERERDEGCEQRRGAAEREGAADGAAPAAQRTHDLRGRLPPHL